MKRCPKCGYEKHETAFYRCGNGSLTCWCKTCRKEAVRQDYQKHKDRHLASARQWREKHPEYHKQWYQNHIEEIKESRTQNKHTIAAYNRHYYLTVTKPKRKRLQQERKTQHDH